MEKKEAFGNLTAKYIDPGDLVQWSKWDDMTKNYDEKIGIVISVSEQVKGNRMVSIARVVPVLDPRTELNFFTMSLKLVSKGSKGSKKD